MRYWVSWWTQDIDEVDTPFTTWVSGERDIDDTTNYSLCAMIDAYEQCDIEKVLLKLYPDYELRFCDKREPNASPGERFLIDEGEIIKTSLEF